MSGILLFHPMREIAVRWLKVRGWRSYIVAFLMHTSMGGIYELLEGLVAVTFDPQTAHMYNGQQGDMWDAHKDMALAMLGTWLAMLIEAAVDQRRCRVASAAPG